MEGRQLQTLRKRMNVLQACLGRVRLHPETKGTEARRRMRAVGVALHEAESALDERFRHTVIKPVSAPQREQWDDVPAYLETSQDPQVRSKDKALRQMVQREAAGEAELSRSVAAVVQHNLAVQQAVQGCKAAFADLLDSSAVHDKTAALAS